MNISIFEVEYFFVIILIPRKCKLSFKNFVFYITYFIILISSIYHLNFDKNVIK